jgi:hypothetical protein
MVYLLIFSTDQSRPNNADLFLLLLNNTSRPFRKEFESQTKTSFSVMAHIFQRNTSNRRNSLTSSSRTSVDSFQALSAERVKIQFLKS